MFIIPVGNRVNWKRPPVVTLLLVILNCFVFFFLQAGDAEQEASARQYYFDSGLPAWELPRYAAYLGQAGKTDAARELRDMLAEHDDDALEWMEHDAPFMHRLHANRVITPSDPEFGAWRAQRRDYESRKSFTSRHVYQVDDPDIADAVADALVSAFMHAGFDHLFGNMAVLFIVGFLVESVIGRGLFALLYLVSIYTAVLVFSLTASGGGALGASGAIAGVMGAYTVIFGWRKIDFFYSLAFYFDYVRAPAIVLLPLWLGNELYQFLTEHGAQVAYMAHFGGLLGGAAMGVLYRWRCPQQIREHHEMQEARESDDKAFQRGMAHLGALEFRKALAVFKALQKKHPQDLQLARLVYRAARPEPASGDYHRAALVLLAQRGTDAAIAAEKHEIFREYWQRAQPAPQLGKDMMARLACYFAAAGYCENAEQLVGVLQRVAPAHQALPAALLALAQGYYRERRKEKFESLLDTLVRQFPQSREAAAAAEMMRVA